MLRLLRRDALGSLCRRLHRELLGIPPTEANMNLRTLKRSVQKATTGIPAKVRMTTTGKPKQDPRVASLLPTRVREMLRRRVMSKCPVHGTKLNPTHNRCLTCNPLTEES